MAFTVDLFSVGRIGFDTQRKAKVYALAFLVYYMMLFVAVEYLVDVTFG